MSSTVIGARVQWRHADQLREIAEHRGLTVSALLAEIVASAIDDEHRRIKANAAYERFWRRLWDEAEDAWEPAEDPRLEVNRKRIKLMAGRLGVSDPIDVQFVADEHLDPGTLGTHLHKVDVHRICIRSGLTPDEAQDTIWHEVGHACQASVDKIAELRRLAGSEAVEHDAEEYSRSLRHTQIVRLAPHCVGVAGGANLAGLVAVTPQSPTSRARLAQRD